LQNNRARLAKLLEQDKLKTKMNLKSFKIEGVEGDLRIKSGFFSFKLYQNDKKLKGKAGKFLITNEQGEQEEIKLTEIESGGLDFAYKVEFRGKKIQRKEKLTNLQFLMRFIGKFFLAIG
jgi:hypothetical protein